MRKSIGRPMKASARHDNRSVDTSPSITQGDLMQPLTDAPPIRPTSTRCRSARQLNPRPTPQLSDAEILFKEPGPPHLIGGFAFFVGCMIVIDRKGREGGGDA